MSRIFKRKPEGVYYIDYCIKGRRIRESTNSTNRKQAERCLASRVGEIVQGRFKLEDLSCAPLFSDFSKKYLDWAKVNKKSWERDLYSIKNLKPFFGKSKLTDIHPFHVESYKIKRKSQVEPATVNREVALLKRILNIAVEWHTIQSNPIRDVKFLKEPKGCERFLSREEATKLVNACPTPFKWIVITALQTGMRRNEILYLKWEYVNLREGIITLTQTKNGEVRYIHLNQTMQRMLNNIPPISEYVFAQSNGKPYSWIGRIWKNVKSSANIECRFHDLRHTYASHLVMNGVDLMTVKELLGHKSLSMVERYAHLSSEHKRKAVETLDGFLSGESGTNVAHNLKFVNKANV